MEEIELPKSDFILMAHSINNLTNRKSFAKKVKDSLNPKGNLLVVGAKSDSEEWMFRKELNAKPKSRKVKSKRENLFEYFREPEYSITPEFGEAIIDLTGAFELTPAGKGVISFYYGRPFESLSKVEVSRFHELAEKYAPDRKLIKKLRYVWVKKS